MNPGTVTRRAAILAGFGGAGALIWNVNGITSNPGFTRVYQTVEEWTRISQRALLARAVSLRNIPMRTYRRRLRRMVLTILVATNTTHMSRRTSSIGG